MRDAVTRERAQLGLQYLEDAVVGLLTDHPDGLTPAQVAERLELGMGLAPDRQAAMARSLLDLLVHSGRILQPDGGERYRDNPHRL